MKPVWNNNPSFIDAEDSRVDCDQFLDYVHSCVTSSVCQQTELQQYNSLISIDNQMSSQLTSSTTTVSGIDSMSVDHETAPLSLVDRFLMMSKKNQKVQTCIPQKVRRHSQTEHNNCTANHGNRRAETITVMVATDSASSSLTTERFPTENHLASQKLNTESSRLNSQQQLDEVATIRRDPSFAEQPFQKYPKPPINLTSKQSQQQQQQYASITTRRNSQVIASPANSATPTVNAPPPVFYPRVHSCNRKARGAASLHTSRESAAQAENHIFDMRRNSNLLPSQTKEIDPFLQQIINIRKHKNSLQTQPTFYGRGASGSNVLFSDSTERHRNSQIKSKPSQQLQQQQQLLVGDKLQTNHMINYGFSIDAELSSRRRKRTDTQYNKRSGDSIVNKENEWMENNAPGFMKPKELYKRQELINLTDLINQESADQFTRRQAHRKQQNQLKSLPFILNQS